MYHTPNLTGIRKAVVPKRLNEGWGLQHMKLYGIDDEIVLSGANLSNDYFTNRQDRYLVFSSTKIADYFAQIYHTMCRMSFVLQPEDEPSKYQLAWPANNACASPLDEPRGFVHTSKVAFEAFTKPHGGPTIPPAPGTASVYPVLIIPQVINTELPAMQALLDTSSRNIASCMFTAGYFNPDPAITSALLEAARAGTATTIVTASPWANGFYGSKGVSGMLPPAYTLLARRFLQSTQKIAPGAVEMREWRLGTVGRPHGWTYHSKGMWLSFGSPDDGKTSQQEGRPYATIVGSSNYTVRSYSLDTEAGAIVISADEKFATKLQREQDNLLEHTRAVTEKDLTGGERRVGPMVRLAMWIVRAIGGSL